MRGNPCKVKRKRARARRKCSLTHCSMPPRFCFCRKYSLKLRPSAPDLDWLWAVPADQMRSLTQRTAAEKFPAKAP